MLGALVPTTTFPTFLVAAAAVDLVSRVGLCSDAVTPLPICLDDAGLAFVLLAGGATVSDGRMSSASSSSEESNAVERRFPAGVLRGWPGGEIALARAAAAATCRLGVTGGNAIAGGGVEGIMIGILAVIVAGTSATIFSSSYSSAGGVAGVTSVARAMIVAAWIFLISSTAAHFDHSNCLTYIYCC